VLIASIYLPNGSPQPGPKFDYKLSWFEHLIEHGAGLIKAGVPVVLEGDYNGVPTEQDIYPTRLLNRNALIQHPTRQAYARLLAQGWHHRVEKKWIGLPFRDSTHVRLSNKTVVSICTAAGRLTAFLAAFFTWTNILAPPPKVCTIPAEGFIHERCRFPADARNTRYSRYQWRARTRFLRSVPELRVHRQAYSVYALRRGRIRWSATALIPTVPVSLFSDGGQILPLQQPDIHGPDGRHYRASKRSFRWGSPYGCPIRRRNSLWCSRMIWRTTPK